MITLDMQGITYSSKDQTNRTTQSHNHTKSVQIKHQTIKTYF